VSAFASCNIPTWEKGRKEKRKKKGKRESLRCCPPPPPPLWRDFLRTDGQTCEEKGGEGKEKREKRKKNADLPPALIVSVDDEPISS